MSLYNEVLLLSDDFDEDECGTLPLLLVVKNGLSQSCDDLLCSTSSFKTSEWLVEELLSSLNTFTVVIGLLHRNGVVQFSCSTEEFIF